MSEGGVGRTWDSEIVELCDTILFLAARVKVIKRRWAALIIRAAYRKFRVRKYSLRMSEVHTELEYMPNVGVKYFEALRRFESKVSKN